MSNELHSKLVDLYAGGELPEELEAELEEAAMADPDLAQELFTLKKTVEKLHREPTPRAGEEAFMRILLRMQQRGADIQTQSPDPDHWQFRLPLQG